MTNLEQSVDDLVTSSLIETSNCSVCNKGELSSIIEVEGKIKTLYVYLAFYLLLLDEQETKSESSDALSGTTIHLPNDYQSPSSIPEEDLSQDTLRTPITSLSRVRAMSFPPSHTSNKMTLFQRAVIKVQQELKNKTLEEETKEIEENKKSKEMEENEESKEIIEKVLV